MEANQPFPSDSPYSRARPPVASSPSPSGRVATPASPQPFAGGYTLAYTRGKANGHADPVQRLPATPLPRPSLCLHERSRADYYGARSRKWRLRVRRWGFSIAANPPPPPPPGTPSPTPSPPSPSWYTRTPLARSTGNQPPSRSTPVATRLKPCPSSVYSRRSPRLIRF